MMKTNILQLFKEHPLLLIELLLQKQAAIQLTAHEFMVIQFLWLEYAQDNVTPSNQYLASQTGLDEKTIRATMNSLLSKKIIHLVSTTVDHQIMEEYDLSPLINLYFGEKITDIKPTNTITEFVAKIEREFSRKLSPIEIQYIQQWVFDQHVSMQLLEEALKETILSGVKSIKYMNAIVNNWQQDKSRVYDTTTQKMIVEADQITDEEKAIANVDWKQVLNEED